MPGCLPLIVAILMQKFPGSVKLTCPEKQSLISKGRKLRPQNTRTNYEQAKFSLQSSNQFRNSTERNIAESKAKYEHTENVPDLNADKPAKGEETFDADSSKFDTTFTTDSEPLTLGFYFPQR